MEAKLYKNGSKKTVVSSVFTDFNTYDVTWGLEYRRPQSLIWNASTLEYTDQITKSQINQIYHQKALPLFKPAVRSATLSSSPSNTTPKPASLHFLLKAFRIKVQQSDGSDGSGGLALFITRELESSVDGNRPIMSPKVQKSNGNIQIKGHWHLTKTYAILGLSQDSYRNPGVYESKHKKRKIRPHPL